MNWLKRLILRWLGLDSSEARFLDIERHFVTRRDDKGNVIQTLADVPVKDRKTHLPNLKGMSWPQKQAWLEKTDGGRLTEKSEAKGTRK